MSLEAAIDKLTAAMTRNSDILEAGLKRSQGATATAPKPGTAAAGKAAATAARKSAPKAPSEEDIRTSFGTYLATKDKAVKEERKEHVRAILGHFGVNTASEIAEENRAEAIAAVDTLMKGELPDFMQGGDEAGEEDDNSGLI